MDSFSMKIPPKFDMERSFERFKADVEAWAEITRVEKEKQGILVTLNLPDTGKYGDLRGKVMETVEDKIRGQDGLNEVLKFLKEHIGQDEVIDVCEKIKAFIHMKREPDQTVKEYVSNFEHAYTIAQTKAKMEKLPGQYLMYALITNANISEHDRKLVLSGLDLSKPKTIYNERKLALLKYCGDAKSAACAEGRGAMLHPESTFWASEGSERRRFLQGNQDLE